MNNLSEKEITEQAWENVRKYNQAVSAAKKTALYEYGDARRWQEFFFYRETNGWFLLSGEAGKP